MQRRFQPIALACLTGLVPSCGDVHDLNPWGSEGGGETFYPEQSVAGPSSEFASWRTANIDVHFSESITDEPGEYWPDSFEAVIANCLSGYTEVLTQEDVTIPLQDGDITCQFRLTSLTYLGENFLFEKGLDWGEQSEIEVTGSLGSTFTFVVKSQIESPIDSSQSIEIIFGEGQGTSSTEGDCCSFESGVDTAQGDSLPLTLHRINRGFASDGDWTLSLDLACSVEGGYPNCDGVALDQMKVGLVGASGEADVLDHPRCVAIAHGGGTGTPISPDGDDFAHGGLSSPTYDGTQETLASHQGEFIFAVMAQRELTVACRYFRLTLE